MIKLSNTRVIDKIEYLFQQNSDIMRGIKMDFLKKLKYNDRQTNIIRIQLKNEVETFYDRTEDFHQKYA